MCYGPEERRERRRSSRSQALHSAPPRLSPLSYRVHVQSVHAQIEGRQVHALKYVLEGLTSAVLDVDDLLGVFLHRSLDESQQVLLIHAGRRVYVCVHLQ